VVVTTLLSASPAGDDPHIHSRVFCPGDGMPEDPVTGSSHCMIAPFYVPTLLAAAGGELPHFRDGSRSMTC
jgi:predicted PhzF superfamily epimerase YddE/YHI9